MTNCRPVERFIPGYLTEFGRNKSNGRLVFYLMVVVHTSFRDMIPANVGVSHGSQGKTIALLPYGRGSEGADWLDATRGTSGGGRGARGGVIVG
jgi:hypothetical protein